MCENWTNFVRYHKEAETMDQFILEYEKNCSKLKRHGIELPQVVLAVQMLEASRLGQKERQLVLTGVDYKDKDNLFMLMKTSLQKFFGVQSQKPCSKLDSDHAVRIKKEEPVIMVMMTEEEGYYTYNHNRGTGRSTWYRSDRGRFTTSGRGTGGIGRGGY